MKIAIIGSGIAGLSACWYLGKEHEVTLIERHALVGMDAHGTDLDWNGKSIRIDVPFRAFKKIIIRVSWTYSKRRISPLDP